MMKFFGIIAAILLLASVPALAGDRSACGPECAAWQSGHGAKPGAPTSWLCTISAPTYGGKVGLDVRNENRVSRWGAPRIKYVGPGVVVYHIGCSWLEQPTAEVYICVQGKDGKQFSSIAWRKKGDLDKVLTTRHLELCLKGPACADFIPGPPPLH